MENNVTLAAEDVFKIGVFRLGKVLRKKLITTYSLSSRPSSGGGGCSLANEILSLFWRCILQTCSFNIFNSEHLSFNRTWLVLANDIFIFQFLCLPQTIVKLRMETYGLLCSIIVHCKVVKYHSLQLRTYFTTRCGEIQKAESETFLSQYNHLGVCQH